MKWIKSLFRKQNNDFFNCHHPVFSGQIEEAFKVNSIQYYRFNKEITMPYGRYQMLQTYYLENELRLDFKLFKEFINAIKSTLDGTAGQVNIGKAFELISKMEARAELAFAPDQAYNLASIVYFDDTENLYKYDISYNKKKIGLWKEGGDLSFFFMTPLQDLLNLKNISLEGLQNYIRVAEQLMEDLTLDTPSA